MNGAILIDTSVLILLIVGGALRSYIALHKNTSDRFDIDDFDLLNMIVKDFSEIILVPHVVAETSSLVRQIGDPRRTEIQRVFARFVSEVYEIPVASLDGFKRRESVDVGVTDAFSSIFVAC